MKLFKLEKKRLQKQIFKYKTRKVTGVSIEKWEKDNFTPTTQSELLCSVIFTLIEFKSKSKMTTNEWAHNVTFQMYNTTSGRTTRDWYCVDYIDLKWMWRGQNWTITIGHKCHNQYILINGHTRPFVVSAERKKQASTTTAEKRKNQQKKKICHSYIGTGEKLSDQELKRNNI